jgi:hypothetical protein
VNILDKIYELRDGSGGVGAPQFGPDALKQVQKTLRHSQNSSGTKLLSRQPNSVQRETYIRANNNKKKIKEADFPAEAPESNSHKYEASNAEHSMHDLSSECP